MTRDTPKNSGQVGPGLWEDSRRFARMQRMGHLLQIKKVGIGVLRRAACHDSQG